MKLRTSTPYFLSICSPPKNQQPPLYLLIRSSHLSQFFMYYIRTYIIALNIIRVYFYYIIEIILEIFPSINYEYIVLRTALDVRMLF